jgi:hypothetical protein
VNLLGLSVSLALILVNAPQSPPIDNQVSPKTAPVKIGAPSVNGIFVNPVPDAPFTATVQILSHRSSPMVLLVPLGL